MEVSVGVNEFVKEVEVLLNNYAKRITELEREKRKEIEKIKEIEDMDLDEMDEAIAECEDEYEDKKIAEESDLIEKIEELTRKYNLTLSGDIFVLEDSHTYASGMGFRHTTVYYLVCTVKLSESKALKVYGEFTESDVYGDYSLNFNHVSLMEIPVINPKKTPFSQELIVTIPWGHIRDTWAYNIEKMIRKITEAEWKGREELKKTVEEVESELKASLWIYDYQHVLNALRKVREKYNI